MFREEGPGSGHRGAPSLPESTPLWPGRNPQDPMSPWARPGLHAPLLCLLWAQSLCCGPWPRVGLWARPRGCPARREDKRLRAPGWVPKLDPGDRPGQAPESRSPTPHPSCALPGLTCSSSPGFPGGWPSALWPQGHSAPLPLSSVLVQPLPLARQGDRRARPRHWWAPRRPGPAHPPQDPLVSLRGYPKTNFPLQRAAPTGPNRPWPVPWPR